MTRKRSVTLKVDYYELKNKTSSVKQGQSVGTAAIGGPFTLLNHDGKPVTEKDFLEERAKLEIVPVFMTVDADRDTVEQVHDYVEEIGAGGCAFGWDMDPNSIDYKTWGEGQPQNQTYEEEDYQEG